MGERAQLLFDKSFADLTKEFNIVGKVNAACIPPPLYQEFLSLYRRSDNLHYKLNLVINDGEHQLIMEEGRGHFNLPPENYLEPELADLGRALKGFDPWYTTKSRNGNVRLKSEQVEGFFSLFAKDYDIVHSLFETFRNTDYLRYHRYLRDDLQVKYAGPTSLQEIMNVYIGIARAHNRQRAYLMELAGAAPR